MSTVQRVDGPTTTVQRVALIFGVGFLLAAIAGFLVTGLTVSDPNPATAPRALGLFPVNVLHNIVHLAFAVWGLLAARSYSASKTYCQVGGVVYLLLVVLALVDPTTFRLVPIGSHDIWLHLILGAGLAYFGFIHRETGVTTTRSAA
jgi:Domain of unknown function (DUF4383)